MGGDYPALALALEELGKVDQSVAITPGGGRRLGAMPIYKYGTRGTEAEVSAGSPSRARHSPVSGSPNRVPVRMPGRR